MDVPNLDLSARSVSEYLATHCRDMPLAERFIRYVTTRNFEDDVGVFNSGRLGVILPQAAALFYLTRTLQAEITIETGFGAGASAGMLVSAKHGFANRFHLSIDPSTGVPNNPVYKYLARELSREFLLITEFSEVALPAIVNEYKGKVKIGFVDGGHHFDTALMDLFYFDKMLALGGVILIDDIHAPAVESACNYWRANRSDYRTYDTVPNTLIFQKILPHDSRSWDHFRPFVVPNRSDWDTGIPRTA
jgi:hypothetical protein